MPRDPMSPTESGLSQFRKLRAKVMDVDVRRFTADVVTEQGGRDYKDVPIVSSYWHTDGAGVVPVLPAIGSICFVELCSDDTPPIITQFADLPEMVDPQQMEAEAGLAVEASDEEEQQMSYSSTKPKMLQEDWGVVGRLNNFIFLRSSGTIEVGASALCQRTYSQVRGTIRDFAENYELSIPGADLALVTDREEDSSDGNVGTRFHLAVNEDADDEKASVQLDIGKLSDSQLLRLIVSPANIDRKEADTVDEDDMLVDLKIAKDGTTYWKNYEFDLETTRSASLTTGKNYEMDINGSHRMSARNSEEYITGTKRIDADSVKITGSVTLGGGDAQPIVGNAIALMAWFAEVAAGAGVSPPPNVIITHVLA